MKPVLTLFWLLTIAWTDLASAQTSIDLGCSTTLDVIDAGFRIEATKLPTDGELVYDATIWYDGAWNKSVAYKGKLELVATKERDTCSYRFVDSKEAPQTSISLARGENSIFEKLNGRPLARRVNGVPLNKDNRLDCKGSKPFRKTLESLCR